MQASCFKIVSMGIVAENKLLSSKKIMIVPIEDLNMVDGELRSNPELLETTSENRDGKVSNTSIAVDSAIEAIWLPFGSNRLTAPDVRRGERVFVWRSGDADQYYWTIAGLDDNLRKLETAIFAFSGTKDESETTLNLDNCYYFEVSTHNKSITLQTSATNGEPFRYTVQINAGEGAFLVEDDAGNSFELESAENRLTLENADNTFIDIKAGKIAINANEEVSLTVGGNKMVWQPASTVLNTGGTVMEWTPASTVLTTPTFKGGS